MAGKSSRFPDTRPKWMLTHPMSGDLMCVESIKGINLDFFDKIYFTFLDEHEKKFNISQGLFRCLEKNDLSDKSEFVILNNSTKSQSETVYMTIKEKNINGLIFIKDSDSYFETTINSSDNQIIYSDLNKIGKIDARTKSYIQMESNYIVTNIVEKKVISTNFCVGGYIFKSTEDFVYYYEKISDYPGECFISHVIFEMILSGQIYLGLEGTNFKDWGTQDEWREYCKSFSTLFVDIDGTLITNTSSFIPPFVGEGKPLTENIEFLNNLFDSKSSHVILTTSRPESLRNFTTLELEKYGIKYHTLIMGLPHSKRILINDFSNSNIYPTSISVNLPRNENTLKNYLT
jgi:hypothetical protein